MQVTNTIETVNVTRPLKVVAIMFLFGSIALLLIALATPIWLKSQGFAMGLIKECSDSDFELPTLPEAPPRGECWASDRISACRHWIIAVVAVSTLANILSMVSIIGGMRSLHFARKSIYYRTALYLAVLAILLDMGIALAFPICFFMELHNWGVSEFELGWSYGVLWGACISSLTAILLLICEKEHEELYYKQKVIYDPRVQESN